MGDALDVDEAKALFLDMGISLDSEINYKDLAKIMVQPFEPKPESRDGQSIHRRRHLERLRIRSSKTWRYPSQHRRF